MSHVATAECRITDLDALADACQTLGWDLRLGQQAFAWYGTWVGDTPATRQMFDTEGEWLQFQALRPTVQQRLMTDRYSRCDHAIQVPGCSYQIGLQKAQDEFGVYYRPVYDFFSAGGLTPAMLTGAGGLAQRYAECALSRTALSQGYAVEREELEGGVVKLTVQRFA